MVRVGQQVQRPLVAAVLQSLVVGGTALTGIAVLSSYSERALLDDLRRSLGQIATTTAALIDADTHERIVAEGRATPAQYEAAARPLTVLLRSNPDLRFAYSAIVRGNTMYYVLDADAKDDPSVIVEANRDPPLPGQMQVWQSRQLTIEQAPTPNSWGVGIRAYAPIRNQWGRMVAFVGVTMRAERYAAAVRDLRSTAAFGATVAILLALTSGFASWRFQRGRNRALDAALAASAVKGEFLATMSHEIRTPLNAVLGMTEIMLRGDLPARQRERAAAVHDAGQHLLHVVDEILDFSKIESGRLALEVVDFDLVDLAEEAVAMFAKPAEGKGLELVLEEGPSFDGPIALRGDPFRLRQILVNLIGNAVKFTEAGEILVSIAVIGQTETEATIEICVADTGIGIPAEAQGKIFDHFSQADGSTTRRYGGTGLGLAICRRLAELMAGSVRVESSPGEGAKFFVRINLAKAPAAPAAPKRQPAEVRPAPKLRGAVLVVEDNLINQQVAEAMLTEMGLDPATANNGREALDLVRARHFDLVLMDCQMPVMDGYEAATAIRQLPGPRPGRLPSLP